MRSSTLEPTPLTPEPPSPRRLASARGLSLVEVTIMLAILLILAGALIPVVSDSIGSARVVRARNDVSQIAVAIVGFQRDVGALVFDGSRLRSPELVASVRPVQLLVSDGEMPLLADSVPVNPSPAPGELLIDPTVGTSRRAIEPWESSSAVDSLDLHLRINGRGYPLATSGPGTGWNGPYVSRPIASDPWGHRYMVNCGYLRGTPPTADGCPNCAVFVISAGPNGVLETPFRQPITNAQVFGDDLAVRIQ